MIANANIETAHNMPSLSTLPRELRDLIYHELWRITPCLLFKTPFKLRYRPRDHHRFSQLPRLTHRKCTCLPADKTPGLPVWLLTSKSMLSEGLDQLFRYAIWQWSAHDRSAPTEYLQATTNPLVGLSKATNLSIYDSSHGKTHRNPRMIAIDCSNYRLRGLDHMLPWSLQTLRLDLLIETSAVSSISLNLSELIPPSLIVERIGITLKVSMWAGAMNAHVHCMFIRDAKEEISRVARLWLCRDEERALEMAMKTQSLLDDPRPGRPYGRKYQIYMTKFQVAREGMLGKVSKSAERLVL